MKGGVKKIKDSQRGGGVIRKSAYEEEGLSDFLFLFYFQTNIFSALAAINGTLLQASDRLTAHTLLDSSLKNRKRPERVWRGNTVQLVPGLPHWFRSLRTLHYCNMQQGQGF